jgi:hypothetical protein
MTVCTINPAARYDSLDCGPHSRIFSTFGFSVPAEIVDPGPVLKINRGRAAATNDGVDVLPTGSRLAGPSKNFTIFPSKIKVDDSPRIV